MRLSQLPERRQAVIHSLAELFGSAAADYIDYVEMNWSDEPYNGGCPVCVATPGVISHIGPGLRLPFGRCVFSSVVIGSVYYCFNVLLYIGVVCPDQ